MFRFLKDRKLMNSTKETKEFSLEGKFKKCKVVDVYDGDTCKVVFYCRGKLDKWVIRMADYDTPEMRPRLDNPRRNEIIVNARRSRDYLTNLIMNNRLVYIKCGKFDKYGRLLGTIYLKKDNGILDNSVNQLMVKYNYAIPYSGGSK
jgi:endonuclease YncB( thermonuclease family)